MSQLSKYAIEVFEFLVHLVFIGVMIILSFLLIQQSIILPIKSRTVLNNDVGEFVVGGVQGENIVVQTFSSDIPVSQVEVRLATYDRQNPGEVYFRVYENSSGKDVFTLAVSAKDIIDNAFYQLKMDSPLKPDTEYALEISGQTPNLSESIGVWSSYTNLYHDGQQIVSGYETEGDIAFRLIAENQISQTGKVFRSILYFSLIIITIFAYLLYQKKFASSFWDTKEN